MHGLLLPLLSGVLQAGKSFRNRAWTILPSLGNTGQYLGGPAAELVASVCVCVSGPENFKAVATGRCCLWKQYSCPQTKAYGQGPQGNKQAHPSLSLSPHCQPLIPHASAWAPVCLCLQAGPLSLTLVPCFPSPSPAHATIKMSHISTLFPVPVFSPQASCLRSLSSLPVLNINNIDNITKEIFLKYKADYITPLLKTLQGLSVAYRVKS